MKLAVFLNAELLISAFFSGVFSKHLKFIIFIIFFNDFLNCNLFYHAYKTFGTFGENVWDFELPIKPI